MQKNMNILAIKCEVLLDEELLSRKFHRSEELDIHYKEGILILRSHRQGGSTIHDYRSAIYALGVEDQLYTSGVTAIFAKYAWREFLIEEFFCDPQGTGEFFSRQLAELESRQDAYESIQEEISGIHPRLTLGTGQAINYGSKMVPVWSHEPSWFEPFEMRSTFAGWQSLSHLD